MGKVYKVNVTFQGTASLEIEGDSPEAIRLKAQDLTVVDLARASQVDILTFKIAAREVTPVSALGGSADGTHEDESGRDKPRPSGWYRPK